MQKILIDLIKVTFFDDFSIWFLTKSNWPKPKTQKLRLFNLDFWKSKSVISEVESIALIFTYRSGWTLFWQTSFRSLLRLWQKPDKSLANFRKIRNVQIDIGIWWSIIVIDWSFGNVLSVRFICFGQVLGRVLVGRQSRNGESVSWQWWVKSWQNNACQVWFLAN